MAETAGVAVGYDELATLKLLALDDGFDGGAKTSCGALADRLDASNQTASRRLQTLEDAGLIERERVADGQWVTVTADGERALRREYAEYRRLFESSTAIELSGTVTVGMGEGRHYITLPGYMTQFEARLGYEPFPGTLNVDLDAEGVRARGGLDALRPIAIDGWRTTTGPTVPRSVTRRRSSAVPVPIPTPIPMRAPIATAPTSRPTRTLTSSHTSAPITTRTSSN